MGEHGLGKYFVGPIDRDDVVFHEQRQQIVLVVRIKIAGVVAEQRRHVQRRGDRDVADLHRFARLGVLAISAALGGKIDDDRARLHACDLGFADEFGRRFAGNGGGGHDQIGGLNVFGQHRGNLGVLFGSQLARVAAFAACVDARIHESRSQRERLLGRRRTNVIAFDDGSQAMRGRDCLESGHAEAHDENLGGTERAPGRGDLRENPVHVRRAELHGIVPRQRRLAGKRVHRLRPSDARYAFHCEARDLALEHFTHQALLVVRVDEADENGAFLHLRDDLEGGGLHAQHDVGVAHQRFAIGHEIDIFVGGVGERDGVTRAGLHVQLGTELDQFRRDRRNERDAPFARAATLCLPGVTSYASLIGASPLGTSSSTTRT